MQQLRTECLVLLQPFLDGHTGDMSIKCFHKLHNFWCIAIIGWNNPVAHKNSIEVGKGHQDVVRVSDNIIWFQFCRWIGLHLVKFPHYGICQSNVALVDPSFSTSQCVGYGNVDWETINRWFIEALNRFEDNYTWVYIHPVIYWKCGRSINLSRKLILSANSSASFMRTCTPASFIFVQEV